MTPEETKAMADRIAANRKEAQAKVIQIKAKAPAKAKAPKAAVKKATKPKAAKPKAKKERVKPIGPATAKVKFKDKPKSRDYCDVLNCSAKPKAGFRCEKHRKVIRKAQLAANNVVWKKRVKAGTAGHHVVYTRPGEKKAIATRFSLKATDKAIKVVSTGHSVVEKVGDFKEIISRTKKERAA